MPTRPTRWRPARPCGRWTGLKLLLIEQPLNEDDLWNHAKLQKQFHTPICLDESILSSWRARSALEMERCRIINIKPGRVGGLSQAVLIHDLCRAHGIPVWCGGMLETGIGGRLQPGAGLPARFQPARGYFRHRPLLCRGYYAGALRARPRQHHRRAVRPGLGVTVDHNAFRRDS